MYVEVTEYITEQSASYVTVPACNDKVPACNDEASACNVKILTK